MEFFAGQGILRKSRTIALREIWSGILEISWSNIAAIIRLIYSGFTANTAAPAAGAPGPVSPVAPPLPRIGGAHQPGRGLALTFSGSPTWASACPILPGRTIAVTAVWADSGAYVECCPWIYARQAPSVLSRRFASKVAGASPGLSPLLPSS